MSTISESIAQLDSRNIYQVLQDFPQHARTAIDIGRSADLDAIDASRIRTIVVTGLGGSAIGGDVLRSYLAEEIRVPIFVNRHYTLPAFVDRTTLVIASSYSGDTEETLSAFGVAREREAQIIVITSGGALGVTACSANLPCIKIPGGFAPRFALAFSFFPMLLALIKLGFIRERDADLDETLAVIDAVCSRSSASDADGNRAVIIARALTGFLPIIYSANDRLDAVALRWRGQFEENAKVLSYGNVFPELNHNEIVGWDRHPEILHRLALVVLRNVREHARIEPRMRFTTEIVREYAGDVIEIAAEGESLLAQTFGLICFGDWISFFLAMLNGVDPFPIAKIAALKAELEKAK